MRCASTSAAKHFGYRLPVRYCAAVLGEQDIVGDARENPRANRPFPEPRGPIETILMAVSTRILCSSASPAASFQIFIHDFTCTGQLSAVTIAVRRKKPASAVNFAASDFVSRISDYRIEHPYSRRACAAFTPARLANCRLFFAVCNAGDETVAAKFTAASKAFSSNRLSLRAESCPVHVKS